MFIWVLFFLLLCDFVRFIHVMLCSWSPSHSWIRNPFYKCLKMCLSVWPLYIWVITSSGKLWKFYTNNLVNESWCTNACISARYTAVESLAPRLCVSSAPLECRTGFPQCLQQFIHRLQFENSWYSADLPTLDIIRLEISCSFDDCVVISQCGFHLCFPSS